MTPAERLWNEVRVGRYSLEIPAEMSREEQEYTFTHITVEEREMPAPPDTLLGFWAKKLAEIRHPDSPPKLPPGQTEIIIEDREVDPGLRQVVYYSSEYGAEHVKLFAIFDPTAAYGRAGVFLTLELAGFADIIPQMTRMIGQTAREYRPPRADGLLVSPPPSPPRFYIERGAIAIPYLRRERATVTFNDRRPEELLTLMVITGGSGATESKSLVDSATGLIATLSGSSRMRILGSGSRVVAGVSGEEVRIQHNEPDETDFFLAYTHPEDSAHPELSLRLRPRGEDLDAYLPLWDRILSSVKRIG